VSRGVEGATRGLERTPPGADERVEVDGLGTSGAGEYCAQKGIEFVGPDAADLLLATCDAMIASENAVLAAEARGIGSCYIGDIMENYEVHRELLGLPEYAFPVGMLCFGYYPEGVRPQPRGRFDRKCVVFEEKYHRLNAGELHEMMREHEAKFNPEAFHTDAENYGQFYYARKTGSDFAAEMARSVKKALENWQGEKLD
jgi:hypothetical protein